VAPNKSAKIVLIEKFFMILIHYLFLLVTPNTD